MLIRQMTREDVPEVAAIEKDCFSLPWSENAFFDAVEDKNALFLVAVGEATAAEASLDKEPEAAAGDVSKEKAQVLGYIGMYLSPPEGEISNVAVAKSARGKALGQSLVKAMKEEGKKRGIDRIILEVRVSNMPAITTYERQGFVALGVRKNFYDMPKEDASIMVWEGQEC